METGLQPNHAELMISIWEKTIDLQIHFNEMCLTLRRTAVTAIGVTLGAGALAFRFGGNVAVAGSVVSVAFLFVLVGIALCVAFFLMDRFWYHELLRASVRYAEDMEQPAKDLGFPCPLDLSRKIRERNQQGVLQSGGAKILAFYAIIAAGLIVAAILLFFSVIRPA